jgi:hypothetical protein
MLRGRGWITSQFEPPSTCNLHCKCGDIMPEQLVVLSGSRNLSLENVLRSGGFVVEIARTQCRRTFLPQTRNDSTTGYLERSQIAYFYSQSHLIIYKCFPNAMLSKAIVTGAYALTSIATLFTISRFVLRRLKHVRFKSDDYIMLSAMLLYWVYTVSYNVIVSKYREAKMSC